MKLSKKEKVAAVATGVWEAIIDIPWNISYQNVVSNDYNAGKLAIGEIEKQSSLWWWPVNSVRSGPFDINVSRKLSGEESFIYNVCGNPFVRGTLLAGPIAAWIGYGLYKYRKLGKDAEWADKRNEAAQIFAGENKDRFSGKDLEEKSADAFLYACSFLDKNRKKIQSGESARDLLNHYYQTFGAKEAYDVKEGKLSGISKTLGNIRYSLKLGKKLPAANYEV